MNFNNFTIKSQEAVQEAVNLVKARGQQAIEPVHILTGVMKVGENVTNFIFQKLGVNGQQIALVVDKQIDSLPKVSGGEPYLSRESNEVLQKATDLLVEIEHQGLFATLEQGIFADIKRPKDGGKGLDGVVVKDDNYFNPFITLMKKEV